MDILQKDAGGSGGFFFGILINNNIDYIRFSLNYMSLLLNFLAFTGVWWISRRCLAIFLFKRDIPL